MATEVGDVRQIAGGGYWRESEASMLIEAWRGSGERLAQFARAPRLRAKAPDLEGATPETSVS